MSYPSYLEYKDPGVRWLGEVPKHWTVAPLKSQTSYNDEVLSENTPGDLLVRYVEIADVDSTAGIMRSTEYPFAQAPSRARRIVRDGDVLISTVRTYLRAIAPVQNPPKNMVASTGFAVVRPSSDGLCGGFLGYLLRAEWLIAEIISRSVGVSYPAIGASELMGLKVPVPMPSEQTQIARFLDHQTARIDALITEQQRLIELLKEKRQAVISHAVTKGLDPDVAMKDSGVEWLGEVPEHWSVASLKHALELVADVDHYMPTPVDSGIPYVMTGDLRRSASEIDLDSCKKISRDEFLKLTRKIKTSEGDVIMARYATIGTVSYVDISEEFVVSYSCVTIRPQVNLVSGIYLFFYFQSDAFIQGISNAINANTQENVGVADLKEVKIALPGIREQKTIVDEVEAKLAKSDALVDEAERSIALMKERRSALISAAVTGKIDVRDWEPPVSETFPQSTTSEEAPA